LDESPPFPVPARFYSCPVVPSPLNPHLSSQHFWFTACICFFSGPPFSPLYVSFTLLLTCTLTRVHTFSPPNVFAHPLFHLISHNKTIPPVRRRSPPPFSKFPLIIFLTLSQGLTMQIAASDLFSHPPRHFVPVLTVFSFPFQPPPQIFFFCWIYDYFSFFFRYSERVLPLAPLLCPRLSVRLAFLVRRSFFLSPTLKCFSVSVLVILLRWKKPQHF